MQHEDRKDRGKFRTRLINPLMELELISMTIPDKPNSSKQQYYTTAKGKAIIEILKNRLKEE